MFFFVVCWIFQNQLFRKFISRIPSECRTVWILIRPDVLSGLIWIQIVGKSYLQMTIGDKGLRLQIAAGKQIWYKKREIYIIFFALSSYSQCFENSLFLLLKTGNKILPIHIDSYIVNGNSHFKIVGKIYCMHQKQNWNCNILLFICLLCMVLKVRKAAKIGNRYNQVPHLTEDTTWESYKTQLNITNKSKEVSPFPAGNHKAAMNRTKSMKNTRHK